MWTSTESIFHITPTVENGHCFRKGNVNARNDRLEILLAQLSQITYTVDLLNPQIFGKNDLYIDYCLFLNPFYVFLFVIIFVESHLTSDCF